MKAERDPGVPSSDLLARNGVESVCILLQEVYLTRCLDGNSLDCSNTLDRG